MFTRRTMIQMAAALPAGADIGLPAAGKLKPRASREIVESPISIGFETLDRKMFQPERTYPHLAELGIKWARAQTGWARTETVRGEYDFRWLDDIVDNLERIGIRTWFNLGYGNRLYTPGAPHESAVGWAPVFTAEARQAWLRYVQRITDRYRGRVKHWEIWNEPNIPNFWQPNPPNPDDYVELVKMTAPEIRKRVPGAVIIGGAFASVPRFLDYLERSLRQGMAGYVDKISYHPYRAIPEANYESDVRAIRGVIARYKPGIEIWQGENGCPSENGGAGALSNLDWNERRQAKWLLRRLLTDIRLGVEVTSYFHTVDMVNYIWSSGGTGRTNFKGVLRGSDYTRKPSYYALQSLCALFDSRTKPADNLMDFGRVKGTPEVAVEAIQSATFDRAGLPLYAYWYPSDLQREFTPSAVSLLLRGGGKALEDPVLVDALDGRLYKLAGNQSGGFTAVDSAPLLDYPLIAAPASAVTGKAG